VCSSTACGLAASAKRLAADAWEKELAPSDELRRWFAHDPARWDELAKRDRRELDAPAAPEAIEDLARRAAEGTVPLLYSARDEEHNNPVVLREVVERARRRIASRRRAA
jgi:uncharacterized protein YeaO (DUF488 family)